MYGSPRGALLLANAARFSWLSFDGVDGLTLPMSGTMAGSSLADIFFLVAISVVVKGLDDRCNAQGLGWSAQANGATQFFGLDVPSCFPMAAWFMLMIFYILLCAMLMLLLTPPSVTLVCMKLACKSRQWT